MCGGEIAESDQNQRESAESATLQEIAVYFNKAARRMEEQFKDLNKNLFPDRFTSWTEEDPP